MEHIHLENNVLFPRALRGPDESMETDHEPHDNKLLVRSSARRCSSTFLVLGFFGREVYRQAPPIPERVVTRRRATLLIDAGRHPRRPAGLAVSRAASSSARSGATAPTRRPDWSADWLHREALALLDVLGRAASTASPSPTLARRAPGRAAARGSQREMRANTLRRRRPGTLTVERRARRGDARASAAHYQRPLRRRPGAGRRCARTTRMHGATRDRPARAGAR